MGYAVKKDGQGWRAVDSKKDIDKTIEVFQEEEPLIVEPPLTIKYQIQLIELSITHRRLREAILTEDGAEWLRGKEREIEALRLQLEQ